jgi:serine acetyltransferase
MNRRPSDVQRLLLELRALYASESARVLTEWNRLLPFGELVVDRWDKARALGFGSGASIYDSAVVMGDVDVGADTWVGPFVVLDGSGGLTIGANCSISAGVQIYSHDTVQWAISGGAQESERAPTIIGDRCYIGPNTIVSKGVSVGSGSVIGANSFVSRDIPAGSRAWGSPARIQGNTELEDPA